MNIPHLIDCFKIIYYEIKARFLLQKVNYLREGSCLKCGDCCRHIYSLDTSTEKEFELTTKIFPKYKRFKIIGRDEYGNLVFACKLLGEDGLCSDYKKRLHVCKIYPNPKYVGRGVLPKRCGFRISPEKAFEDYLK